MRIVQPWKASKGRDHPLKGRGVAIRSCVSVGAALTVILGGAVSSGVVADASSLPPCPIFSKLPVKAVSGDVLAAIKSYYTARHLAPVAVYKNQETVLNVKQNWAGTHYCRNLDGSTSGYVGTIPKTATAAVMVHVKHKPYPVTMAASTFVTLAKIPGKGWKVTSDDTAP